MRMRRARAYSSFCSQIILVCLSLLFCNRKSQKITNNPYFGGSRSFKVNDVDISKKLIASACYDKQLVCAYL